MKSMFEFKDFSNLSDEEIKLVIKSRDEADINEGYSPRYGFSIIHIKDNKDIGVVYFSVGNTRQHYLTGHLSYGVSPAYNGHNFARKACLLLKPVIKSHGFNKVMLGSSYDNIASRRTIKKLGAIRLTMKDVSDKSIFKELEDKRIEMYVWSI